MDKKKITFIDGSANIQEKAVNEFLSLLTQEEIDYSMSNDLSYLDEIENI